MGWGKGEQAFSYLLLGIKTRCKMSVLQDIFPLVVAGVLEDGVGMGAFTDLLLGMKTVVAGGRSGLGGGLLIYCCV